MTKKDYNQIISENFDIYDNNTRKILLSINEQDQNQVLSSLASKLYKVIVNKSCDIDFGKIPESKGDITKIPNYPNMIECLDIIKNIVIQYNQSTSNVDIILDAIENIKKSKDLWEKGFNTKSSMTITTYNTLVLSIVSSVSLMISTSIEFIKDPEIESFDFALNKVEYSKTKDSLLFKNLDNFNKSFKSGNLEKSFNELIKSDIDLKEMCEDYSVENSIFNESIIGAISLVTKGVAIGAFIVEIVKIILPLLQQLVWILLNSKQKLSDYLDIQSNLIRLNAEKLEYNESKSESEKNKIYKKQIKIADGLKKLSNKLSVKIKSAENKTKKDFNNAKKYKIGDVIDDIPDSAPILF